MSQLSLGGSLFLVGLERTRRTGMLAALRSLLVFVLGATVCCLLICAVYIGVRNLRLADEAEVCYGNLVTIHAALCKYAASHEGLLPPSLSLLVERRLLSKEQLRCPTSHREYLYLLGQARRTWGAVGPGEPVVAEPGFPHGVRGRTGGYMHYLTGSGAVSSVSVGELSEAQQHAPSTIGDMIEAVERYRVEKSP